MNQVKEKLLGLTKLLLLKKRQSVYLWTIHINLKKLKINSIA